MVGAATDFTPRKRHLFALRLDLGTAPIAWAIDDAEWYVRPDGGGVLASACDHTVSAPGDVDVDPAVRAALRARLPPSFAALTIDRAWACQRTYARGGTPRVGFDPQVPWWLWVAGLGGHGVTACAAVAARAVAVLAARG
jgi:D-arginine dehydrogenase